MINRNKLYSQVSVQKYNSKREINKQSILMAMILRRLVKKKLKDHFNYLKNYGTKNHKILSRFSNIVIKNLMQAKIVFWKQLRSKIKINKKNDSIILKISGINKRYVRRIKIETINLLKNISINNIRKQAKKFEKVKQFLIPKILNRLIKQKLKISFKKIIQNKFHQKIKLKQVRKLLLIAQNLKSKTINYSFSKILNYKKQSYKDTQKIQKLYNQIDRLKKESKVNKLRYRQFQDRQITQSRITQSKIAQSRTTKKRSASQTSVKIKHKRSASTDKDDKKSNQGNYSVISILNGSFLTFKSRKSQRQDSMNGAQCFCKYREKYNHYRDQSNSYKNQLQIMKSELEMTKDLNDHLQNEFCEYFSNDHQNKEKEILRKELKEIKKQRQYQRQKIAKYQKYISNLKYQFKSKMQNLYRNIKKN